MAEVVIRPACAADADALTRLYNHYVEQSPATFDIESKTLEEREEWMGHYADSGPHRLLVAGGASRRAGVNA